MKPKVKTFYTCQSCGYKSPKWLGKCPDCSQWNSFVEERFVEEKRRGGALLEDRSVPQPITAVSAKEEDRVKSGITELDRVLGGGIVLGSAVLIGGDPGIGKSTLLLQAMGKMAQYGAEILYVTGEESVRQIKIRADRLNIKADSLLIYAQTSLERIIESIKKTVPTIVVIDSIQTIYTENLESAPGSVSQIRETAYQLIMLAKAMDVPVFLVGHVTKDGAIAGPRVLEHMVDTVLYFEGERGHPFRLLRAVKNRYGSQMEIGVFEMKDIGLEEVSNPSQLFLAERPENAPGSVVVSSLEGTRPILVEVQSLVCPTVFGMPRRTVVGIESARVSVLVAVLEKKIGLNMANQDIFLKVAGGLKLDEPAVDLGILASIASNYLNKPVDSKTVVFGEVGLAGEVRAVSQAELRLKESKNLGFERCIMPKDKKIGSRVKAGTHPSGWVGSGKSIEIIGVSSVKEAIDVLF